MKLNELLQQISPLPWKFNGTRITSGEANIVAVCSKVWSDDDANTACLTHCANTLPALLKAAQHASDTLQSCSRHPDWGQQDDEQWIALREAIAAAENIN